MNDSEWGAENNNNNIIININNTNIKESGGNVTGPPSTGASQQTPPPGATPKPTHAKEYNFLDMELKYGILQVSLAFLLNIFIILLHVILFFLDSTNKMLVL